MTQGTVERLRNGRDIRAVLEGRQQRSGSLMAVHTADRSDPGPARLAIIASRRVGSAVARNRAKRLIREAARTIDWRPSMDVVVIARRACSTSRLQPVQVELAAIAHRLGVTRQPV